MSEKAPANARTIAQLETGGSWREYKNMQEVPELDATGGSAAEFWRNRDGALTARVVVPGEDFWIYTRYCFDDSNRLTQIGFELRTGWGWGYRLDGVIAGSKLHPTRTQFFDTENEKAITRPAEADSIPEALTPVLYLEFTKLPFARLLGR